MKWFSFEQYENDHGEPSVELRLFRSVLRAWRRRAGLRRGAYAWRRYGMICFGTARIGVMWWPWSKPVRMVNGVLSQ